MRWTPVGAAHGPGGATALRRRGSCVCGNAADPELPAVSTLDHFKAMRRASSESESRLESERLPELDIARDSIENGVGTGEDGAREESE